MSSVADTPADTPAEAPASGVLARLARDRMGAMGAVLVAAFVTLALFAPWIAPADPLKLDVLHKLQGPSLQHWAGTDQLSVHRPSSPACCAPVGPPRPSG